METMIFLNCNYNYKFANIIIPNSCINSFCKERTKKYTWLSESSAYIYKK